MHCLREGISLPVSARGLKYSVKNIAENQREPVQNVSSNNSWAAPLTTLHPELLVATSSSGETQECNFLPSPTKTMLFLEDIFRLDNYSKNARRVLIFFYKSCLQTGSCANTPASTAKLSGQDAADVKI